MIATKPNERETIRDAGPQGAGRDDARLVRRLRAGDGAAFEELVRSSAGWTWALARRLTGDDAEAADAVQEAFAKVWAGLEGFRGEASLRTWMKRIVINESLQRLRRRSRRHERSLEGLLPRFDGEGRRLEVRDAWQETGEQLACRGEVRVLVRRCVERLPDGYRTVIVLRDVEELSTEATAEALGIRPGAVKTRLHRARLALRTLLEHELAAVPDKGGRS